MWPPTFLKCSWASRSFFFRAAELDSSWFQRFIRAAWRASMALDWTCLAVSSWSFRAVMLVMPSCWKACRPASNVSCRGKKLWQWGADSHDKEEAGISGKARPHLFGEQSLHWGKVSAVVISFQAVFLLAWIQNSSSEMRRTFRTVSSKPWTLYNNSGFGQRPEHFKKDRKLKIIILSNL